MRRAIALLFALALLLAGCGGDDGSSGGGSAPSEAAANPGGSLSPDDGAEIEDAIKTWLLEGDCDVMTAAFLEDQIFIDEPAEACEAFENAFSAPSYSADAIIVSDIEGEGDRATAVVSDDFSNVKSTYRLKNEDGVWKIDSVDIS